MEPDDFEIESREEIEDIEETEGARFGVKSGVRIDLELAAGVLGILLTELMM